MARDRTGGVPIGHHIIDPRTAAKATAFNLDSVINPIGQSGANQGMNSDIVQPKEFDYSKHPLPRDPGRQSPKVAAAGKVVDPTAIESATGIDSVTMETSISGGPA